MYEGGLVHGAMGAIGLRLRPGEVAVTREGCRIGFLEGSDFVRMNGNGRPLEPNRTTPCRDATLLSAVLSARPDAGSVVRVHSPYTTALAFKGRGYLEKSQHMVEHLGGVSFVPYYRQGTAGLAGAVSEVLRSSRVALIEGQGAVVWGTDVDDAVDLAEALEAAAQVILILDAENNGDGA